MRIFRLPLEVLPERYTEQWASWFPSEMERNGFDYNEIPGDQISSSVNTGKVLDASGTMIFKFSQLEKVAKLFSKGTFRDGDSFFVDDIQFPGIWAIKYMAHLYGIKVFVFGYLHASSYTKEDFAEPMAPFMKGVEKSWIFTYDKIFTGTNYSKMAFVNRRFPTAYRRKARECIYVTGAPWNVWSVQTQTYRDDTFTPGKVIQIIFPNRFDIEKRPNVFLKVVDFLYNRFGSKYMKFVITTSRKGITSDPRLEEMLYRAMEYVPTLEVKVGLSKTDYYKELAKSKLMVSTTIEENFGYCVTEALSLNTPVLVPNNYSHPEILGDMSGDQNVMLYDINFDEYKNDFDLPSDTPHTGGWNDKKIVDLAGKIVYSITYFDNKYDNIHESVLKYNDSISNMCRVMKAIVKNG